MLMTEFCTVADDVWQDCMRVMKFTDVPPNQLEVVFNSHVTTALICLGLALVILVAMKWSDFVNSKKT